MAVSKDFYIIGKTLIIQALVISYFSGCTHQVGLPTYCSQTLLQKISIWLAIQEATLQVRQLHQV
jgi:hypothetical protein